MQISVTELRPADLNDDWESLVRRMPRPTPFLSRVWLAAWLANKDDARDAVLIRGLRDGRLVGLLPLVRRVRRTEDTAFPGRVLSIAGALDMGTDHLDLIAAPEDRADFLAAVVDFLADQYTGWDLFVLDRAPEDSAFVVHRDLLERRFDLRLREASRSFVLDATAGMDQIYAAMTSKKRRESRRVSRRFFDEPGNTYAVSTADELPGDLAQLLDLHLHRIDAADKTSIFGRPDNRAVFEQSVAAWGPEHVVLGKLLVGGEIQALNLAFRFGNRYFDYQMSTTDEARTSYLGHVLSARLIQQSCEDGCSEFDLLRGTGHHKRFWSDRYRSLYNLVIVNRNAWSPLHRIGLAGRAAARRCKQALQGKEGS